MLSVSVMSGGQASYYLSLAREDYYVAGGEPPGKWYGKGAELLGLTGTVEGRQLYNLFDGRSGDGSTLLVQLQRKDGELNHRPGWDLTFSVPKSVSVLWSQLGLDDRVLIQNAHDQAVKKALDYLQDNAIETRRGKSGSQLERGEMVVALFEHSTSRALDPQLHTHALLMNVCVRADGSTGTVSSLDVFLSKMAAGAIYRLELATILSHQLGVPVHAVKNWFEVSGVSDELIAEFSKRRAEIESLLKEKGLSSAEASAVAAIETRAAKELISRVLLGEEWRETGDKFSWSESEAAGLLRSVRLKRSPETALKEVLAESVKDLTFSQAHFTERDFVRAAAEMGQVSGLYVDELLEGTHYFLQSSEEIVRLGRHRGEERFTTKGMLELEQRLLSAADALFSNEEHVVTQDVMVRVLGRNEGLSLEQSQAVWHIAHSTGALAIVSGIAGTGKTTMLKAAKEAWEAAGFIVDGTALAGKAARQLGKDAEMDTNTIASLIRRAQNGTLKLTSKTILVVDEAGMVATPELEWLARMCQTSGAKLVLIGDAKQLQPIGPGAPFMELGARYGQAELVHIYRQKDEWAVNTVMNLRAGKSKEALEEFVKQGLVRVTETRDEAMSALINDWAEDKQPISKTLLLAGTRADKHKLNHLAQAKRLENGELGDVEVKIAGETFRVGDRLIFKRKYATLQVVNGERGTLVDYDQDRNGASVRLDTGERITFDIDAMHHVELGYASTTHGGQGATTNATYVLAGGPMQDRELSYVQGSRAEFFTRFYMTRMESGDEMEKIAREMARSRQKEMASTVIRLAEQRQNEITRGS
ncbi:MAG: MobF family relaxase [Armatimonadota bacterium]